MDDVFMFRVNYCLTDPECTRITYITGIPFWCTHFVTLYTLKCRAFEARFKALPIFSRIHNDQFPKRRCVSCTPNTRLFRKINGYSNTLQHRFSQLKSLLSTEFSVSFLLEFIFFCEKKK